MLRRMFGLIVGVAGGMALASYVSSDRGRDVLRRAAQLLREVGLIGSTPQAAGTKPGATESEAAIEAKIEETRQRLREQLLRSQEDGPTETDSTS